MQAIPTDYLEWTFNTDTAGFLLQTAAELRVKFFFQRDAKLRLGSFRADDRETYAKIMIRRNLPPGHMLIIFCHELAHAMVWRHFGRRVKSHGEEWQDACRLLLRVSMQLYPYTPEWKAEALEQIEKPKATYRMNIEDVAPEKHQCLVDQLNDGQEFLYKQQRYIRLEKKRTRILCRQLPGRRRYLFQPEVVVTPLSLL